VAKRGIGVEEYTQEVVRQLYLTRLCEWWQARFKWTVPETIPELSVERGLMNSGLLVFYRDAKTGAFMLVRATPSSLMNIYDEPATYTTIGAPGYEPVTLTTAFLHVDEQPDNVCVPLRASINRETPLVEIGYWANRLTELDHTLAINSRLLRTPRIAMVPQSQVLSVRNVLREIDKGQPDVIASEDSGLEGAIGVLDVGGNPANLQSVRLERNQVWNDCMTWLGINSSNQDKKERLVAAETTGNDDQVAVSRAAAKVVRDEAVSRINKVWPDANVSCDWAGVDLGGDANGCMDDAASGDEETVS